MIPYTIEMTPKTARTIEKWVQCWTHVWSVEGTSLITAAFRPNLQVVLPKREHAHEHLVAAGEALIEVRYTKSTAKLSLPGLTDRQISGLLWVMMVARTGHKGQHNAYQRLYKLVERFNKRSPLIRLAECAQ